MTNTFSIRKQLFVIGCVLAVLLFGAQTVSAATIFGDSVATSTQGLRKDSSAVLPAHSDPLSSLGAPEATGADGTFFSLGYGGTITIEFAEYVGTNLSVTVHETTNGVFPLETADVEVSIDGISWTPLGEADNNLGAGPNPQDTTFALPADSCIKFIRVTDTSDPDLHGDASNGFDIDGVSATYDEECTPPAPPPPPPPPPPSGGCNTSSSSGSISIVNGIVIVANQSGCISNTTSSSASTGGNSAAGSRGGRGGRGGDVEANANGGSSSGNNGSASAGAGGAGGVGGPGGVVTSGGASSSASSFNRLNRLRIRLNIF